MKSLRLVVGFLCLMGVSVAASAATAPVNCSWRTTSVATSGSGTVTTEVCADTGVDVVSTQKGSGQGVLGTLCTTTVLKSGYSYTGTCGSAGVAVYKESLSSCGVNAGKSYGTVIVGMYQGTYYPFPTASVNNFCGACGYNATSIGGGGAYSQQSVSCKL